MFGIEWNKLSGLPNEIVGTELRRLLDSPEAKEVFPKERVSLMGPACPGQCPVRSDPLASGALGVPFVLMSFSLHRSSYRRIQ